MSTIISTAFTKYAQTRNEQLAGSSFSVDQEQFIQTLIATTAEERMALEPDPLNYAVFIQQDAYLKGQIASLQYLLDCSVESRKQLYSEAAADSHAS